MNSRIVEKQLSDGSFVYNVHVSAVDAQGKDCTVVIGAVSFDSAAAIERVVNNDSVFVRVGEDVL
jgi:hypothetical protein